MEYFFEKPGSGIQPKLSYATMIPGTDILVGAGVYLDDVAVEQAALAWKHESRNQHSSTQRPYRCQDAETYTHRVQAE